MLSALPAHVAAVYKQGSQDIRFQLLPLAWLLDLCNFPARQDLLSELFWGFKLLGPLPPGSGWLNRTDAKYSRPLIKCDFFALNAELCKSWCMPSPQSEHHATLLAELNKEVGLGRVQGPVPLSLLSPDVGRPVFQVACGFPILQDDKIRRCDDWLRSHHNSCPRLPALFGRSHCGCAISCSRHGTTPALLSAVDHEGAYRSLPVRDPHECGVLLPGTPPTFWSHFALPFGSVVSVWGYLRVADVAAFLSVTLLLTLAAHYVDDFFSVEQSLFAESSFATFQAFHRLLGFRMKEAKSKPPRNAHTLLGIDWTFAGDYVRAEPGQSRIERLVSTIQGFLDSDVMSSAECSPLTGRLCFTCTWVFGHVGRSFLQPLYFRQHHGHPGHSKLTPRVRQALRQIQRLLGPVQPRFPLQVEARQCLVAHLYANAFITLRGVRRSARRWLSEEPPLQELRASTRAVFAVPGKCPVAFRGEVPTFVLADLASSRAYIFWLEALAQVLSLLTVSQLVRHHVMCWINNTSAEHALNKGYSKCPQ